MQENDGESNLTGQIQLGTFESSVKAVVTKLIQMVIQKNHRKTNRQTNEFKNQRAE